MGARAVGRIEVICGCMFAGKTARLIEVLRAAHAAGQSLRAFKHRIDTRYGVDRIATHDGRFFPAEAVGQAGDLLERVAGIEVIGIDEAQFFGRPLVDVCTALRHGGQRVILAGIDNDAWGRPFPPLPQLKEIADHVQVLDIPCTVCGHPARFSQRMTPVTDPHMVGGPGDYEPRCGACFHPLPPPAPRY